MSLFPFTAEEEQAMHRARLEALEHMANFGRGRRPAAEAPPAEAAAGMLDTKDAAIMLGCSESLLAQAVKKGRIKRHRREDSRCFYYCVADLEQLLRQIGTRPNGNRYLKPNE